MDAIVIVLLTAAAVSVDSFVCGCGLGRNKGLAPVVAAVTLFMCLLFQLLGEMLTRIADASLIGTAVLALIGINMIIKKDDALTESALAPLSPIEGRGIGAAFSVAVDGALGAMSLTALGYNGLICSFAVAFFHYLFFLLGEKIGSLAGGRERNIAGGIALIVLSVTKFI